MYVNRLVYVLNSARNPGTGAIRAEPCGEEALGHHGVLAPRLHGAAAGGGRLAGGAGTQFNRNIFGLSFGLKNHLSFGLRFSNMRKCSKMGSSDTSQNQNGISIRFSSQN